MTRTDPHDILTAYGVPFEGEQGEYVPTEESVTLAELARRGGRVVRVRWIGGDYIPGRGKCYDLSYIHGEIVTGRKTCPSCNGRGFHSTGGGENFQTSYCTNRCDENGEVPAVTRVRVEGVNVSNLTPRRELKGELIRWAVSEGVYAKRIGLLDDANFSILG